MQNNFYAVNNQKEAMARNLRSQVNKYHLVKHINAKKADQSFQTVQSYSKNKNPRSSSDQDF